MEQCPDCDDGKTQGEPCPACCGIETFYDVVFGLWECDKCHIIWGTNPKKTYYNEFDYHETCSETNQEDE